MSTPAQPTVWIVLTPSAYRFGVDCYLGRGASKPEALENAFGPKPWSAFQKSSAKRADCYQVTVAEADALEAADNYAQ